MMSVFQRPRGRTVVAAGRAGRHRTTPIVWEETPMGPRSVSRWWSGLFRNEPHDGPSLPTTTHRCSSGPGRPREDWWERQRRSQIQALPRGFLPSGPNRICCDRSIDRSMEAGGGGDNAASHSNDDDDDDCSSPRLLFEMPACREAAIAVAIVLVVIRERERRRQRQIERRRGRR